MKKYYIEVVSYSVNILIHRMLYCKRRLTNGCVHEGLGHLLTKRDSALQKLLAKTGSLFVNATKDLFIIGALSIVTMYRTGARPRGIQLKIHLPFTTKFRNATRSSASLIYYYFVFCQSLLLLL